MQSVSDIVSQYTGKRVLVRANFDVPLENGQIGDTTRIEDALPTLTLLRQHQCSVIILAHAGRPEGRFDSQSSLAPIAAFLSDKLGEPVVLAPYAADYHQIQFPDAPVILMDNLRFWPEEESNDPEFAKFLATKADLYVNEAFAVNHRKHASIVGIPTHLPHVAGISLTKEMAVLDKVKDNPEHPLVIVIGGVKLETKMPLVQAFTQKADQILVGGKIAVEMKDQVVPANVMVAQLTPDTKDITESSAKKFADIIMSAKTVIWNGTMGVFEEPAHELGTKIVAEAINTTSAFTLMGGGDTETALTHFNLEAGIDYISTGGGAMLTYLSEGRLDGIDALNA